MRKIEIKAYSVDEAKEIAKSQYGIGVVANVTPSYKKAGEPTGDKFKLFMGQTLEKRNLVDVPGTGLLVTVDPGTKDTKLRPYEFVNNIVEGTTNFKRVNELRLKSNDKLIGEASKKGDAVKLAKKLMLEYKEDIVCKIVYRAMDPDRETAFELTYKPSANTKQGTYVVFGTPAE